MYDRERGYKGENREELGLEFIVDHYTWKRLPHAVFDLYGSGGRTNPAAKEKRAVILEQKASIENQTNSSLLSPNPSALNTTAGSKSNLRNQLTAVDEEVGGGTGQKRQKTRSGSIDESGGGLSYTEGGGRSISTSNKYEVQLEKYLTQVASWPSLTKPASHTVETIKQQAPMIINVVWTNLSGES